jgi:hypothetical protein
VLLTTFGDTRGMTRAATLLVAALAAVFATSFGGPAHAAEKPGAPGTNVDMPILMAPMSKDGMLLGYAYIKSVLVATSPRAAIVVREKVPFIQDAFVRDVNAAPVGLAADPTKVDRALLAARLGAVARRIIGADKIVGINFSGGRDAGIEFAPLHPTETPQPAETPTTVRAAAAAATAGQ